ncbi:hypothetical protein F5Y01DRAFT_316279 [Xylaria sp. FL0043]|nr:hypothetical protein F5Y01DRAFT_316279 [Xylaria sp. FL0043]
MALNGIVEFFSDTTNSGHIYLARPLSVIQSLNYEITMTGGRLRALTPIRPTVQLDQEYDPFTYDVGPSLIDPRLMLPEDSQTAPSPTIPDIDSCPYDFPQTWTPLIHQQFPPSYPSHQGAEYTSSPVIVSPTPVRVSNNGPAVLSGRFRTGTQHLKLQPAAEYNSPKSSTTQTGRQASPPGRACANIQPAPSKEPPAEEKKEKIPRPQNAFIQYRNATLQQVKASMRPGATWQEISLEVSKRWKALPEEEKKPFRDGQTLAEAEHKRLYPDYKYQPGEKKKSRSRKL